MWYVIYVRIFYGDRNRKELGAIGEQHACTYLAAHGFQIIQTNAYSRWGELDIIASKNGRIHFIEVKTRSSKSYGAPYEAVSRRKIQHLQRTIQYYILQHKLQNFRFQLDVIAIMVDEYRAVTDLRYYENVDVDRFY